MVPTIARHHSRSDCQRERHLDRRGYLAHQPQECGQACERSKLCGKGNHVHLDALLVTLANAYAHGISRTQELNQDRMGVESWDRSQATHLGIVCGLPEPKRQPAPFAHAQGVH
jgi:hypothetical protein